MGFEDGEPIPLKVVAEKFGRTLATVRRWSNEGKLRTYGRVTTFVDICEFLATVASVPIVASDEEERADSRAERRRAAREVAEAEAYMAARWGI